MTTHEIKAISIIHMQLLGQIYASDMFLCIGAIITSEANDSQITRLIVCLIWN